MKKLLSKLRGNPFFHAIRHPYKAVSEACRKKRNAKRKARLQGKEPTLLCNDCLAGVILSDYNLPCNTPIINCGIKPTDFVKYLENIEHYRSCELIEKNSNKPFPVGELVSPLGNIEIEFTHYSSFKEAKMLWKRRTKRMDLTNIYAILDINMYNPVTENDIARFAALPFPTITITTEELFRHCDGCFFIDLGKKKDEPGVLLKNKDIFGHRFYDAFDFIGWMIRP